MSDEWSSKHCEEKHGYLEKLHDTQIADIKRRVSVVEGSLKENLDKIYSKIEQALARPSWIVLAIISLLTSAVVGLLVKSIK